VLYNPNPSILAPTCAKMRPQLYLFLVIPHFHLSTNKIFIVTVLVMDCLHLCQSLSFQARRRSERPRIHLLQNHAPWKLIIGVGELVGITWLGSRLR
jgi:hypothetical protein